MTVMSSDKCNFILARAAGSLFSLFNIVTLSQEVSFYDACIMVVATYSR